MSETPQYKFKLVTPMSEITNKFSNDQYKSIDLTSNNSMLKSFRNSVQQLHIYIANKGDTMNVHDNDYLITDRLE